MSTYFVGNKAVLQYHGLSSDSGFYQRNDVMLVVAKKRFVILPS